MEDNQREGEKGYLLQSNMVPDNVMKKAGYMKKNKLKDKVFSDKLRVPGVYRIVFVNGTNPLKYYYGSTYNLCRRRLEHRSDLKCGTHHVPDMQTDYNIFGIESFHFEVIATYATVEEANKAEEVLLASKFGNNGCYNISKLAKFIPGLGPANPVWNKPWTQGSKDKRTATADAERLARIAYKNANNIPLSINDKYTPEQREAHKQSTLKSKIKTNAKEKDHAARALRALGLTQVIPSTSP